MRKVSSLVNSSVAVDRLTTQTDYDNIVKVKDNLPAINTIALNVADLVSVETIHAEIVSLYSDKVKLDSLYADKVTLDGIYSSKVAIDSLYVDKAALDSLYADKVTLDSIFADKTALDSLFSDKTALDSLFSDKIALDSLYADKAKLDSLYADKTTLDAVYSKLAEVGAVGTDVLKGKGTNTATDSAVLNALDNANIATTQAGVATTQASAASVSEVNALASENAAKVSETNSKASEVAAASSKTTANTQASVATTKATESANSAAASLISETNSATSAANALTSETNAKTSETNAATSASNSLINETNALTSANTAATSASAAATSSTNASTSSTVSKNWATHTVDVPVPSGNGSEYSAKHWASKAAAAATGSLHYLGVWNATTAFPANPILGDYHKVSVAGPEAVAPYTYNQGDAIVYNGATWDLIDSSDAVNSVDGQIGAVNLSAVYEPKNGNIQGHIASTANPHAVTKLQIGLGNVNNTSDANKPVSTAQGTRFTAVEATANAALPTSSYTASDVLAKVKAVDGAGSGLDADLLDGLNSTQFLRSDATDYIDGTLYLRNDIVTPTGNRNRGMFGTYDSYKTDHIWSIGTGYRNAADGTNFGNLYGLAYKYTNNTTGGSMAGGHQMVWCQNGTGTSAMGTNIWTSGAITAGAGATVNGVLNQTGGLRQDGVTVLNGSDTWLRTTGATGWYSSTYGGGWYMSDTIYVRAYNSKSVFTSGTFVEASDKRLKENIKTIDNATDKISKLRGVMYNKISTPGKEEMGLIAQEVEEVVPEVVGTDATEEGMKNVSYARLVALLIESNKEQIGVIAKMQKGIESLTLEVSTLKGV